MNNSASLSFNYTYDSAGHLQTQSNTYAGTTPNTVTPMLTSATYYASGQLQTMTTNTGTATVTGTYGLDKRLRITSYQNLSTANSGYTNYGYSLGYTANSNLLTDSETVYDSGAGQKPWSWNFAPDTLNRLTSATMPVQLATATGAYQFGCVETYDQWGNRTGQSPATSPSGVTCTSSKTPIAAGTNRITGASYDPAGNLLYDGTNTLTYDAEGRIATSTQSGAITTYIYGADSQRAGKIAGGVETNYVRDLDGTLLVNYSTGSYDNGNQEMWLLGKHFGTAIVPTGGGSISEVFSLTNWLGSEAARTTPATGIPTSAYLTQPYGDGQTILFGSNADDIHFTGKERDGESGNDYFSARYYTSTMGRFSSPDPSRLDYADPTNPQSFNLYSYVMNNPLINVDPTGLKCITLDDGSVADDYIGEPCDQVIQEDANNPSPYEVNAQTSTIAPSNPAPLTPQQLQDQQNAQVCKVANVAAATFGIQAVTFGVAGGALTLTVAGAPAGALLLGGAAVSGLLSGGFWLGTALFC